jgi:23S rRNA pseudouridine1911/1915/1917 synthase
MASIGHPVVGDTLYGAPRELQARKPAKAAKSLSLPRNFLHSTTLQLDHPRTGQALSFSCPLPAELQRFMASLQQKD